MVNFFDGGERDRITLSLDGEEPVPMDYIERPDPSYVRQYQKYKGTADAYRPPAISSHIWQFALPRLKPGLHSAEIHAVDEFGFEDRAVFMFEITRSK